MSPPIRQFSFSAGELSPSLYARTDLDRYANGLRTCRNMMVMRQGGATGRPGTEYVATALNNSGQQVRLIPFIFNETGLGQSYVLEFGLGYIQFYQNGGNVISSTATISGVTQGNPATVTATAHGFSNGDYITISGILGMTQLNNGYFIVAGVTTNTFTLKDVYDNNVVSTAYGAYISGGVASKIYRIASPYAQADLQSLNYGQSADVLTIVHPSYFPMELSRAGATSWTLADVVFGPSSGTVGVNTLVPTGGGTGTYNASWGVTMVLANGDETTLSEILTNGLVNIGQPTPTNPISLTWHNASAEPAYYKVYRSDISSGVASLLGYVGTVPAGTHSFLDTVTDQDFTNTPPVASPFESEMGAGNYPSVVGFSQQRRFFGAWNNNPVGFAGSTPGNYSNFDVHTQNPSDSDPIFGTLAGEEVNAISALTELKFMLIITTGAEIYVQGNGSGVVTPSAINASVQSQFGAKLLKPLKAGDQLIFTQALGNAVRDFAFDFAIDGYRGNDITIFSAHLFEGYQIVDWCYQKVPDSMIWAVRSDGVLLSCTYVREQQVIAWARHDFVNGFIENICAIPENGEYAVYASIQRFVNGKTVRYIERISSRLWPDTVNTPPVQYDPINASYLDAFLKFDGRNNTNTTMKLTAPATSITITTGINDGIDFEDSFSAHYFAIIPGGTYTPTTLAAAIQTAMHSASGLIWTVSLSGDNLHIANGDPENFTLLFAGGSHLSRSAAVTIGWLNQDYLSTGFSLTAPNPPFSVFSSSNTAYTQMLTLTSSVAFFNSGMVGDQIFLEDEEWIQSQGKEGNQVRLSIQQYTDSEHVIVTPSETVPAEFQNLAITTWALAVQTVSGLLHLEGQIVSVWADRFVVGSPLNSQVDTIYTVSGGSVTLDKPYSVIYIGLPMIQDLEPLDLESYFGETMLGKRKRVSRVSVYVYNTRTFFAGGENPDTNQNNTNNNALFQLYEEKDGTNQATYDVAPELITAQDYVITPSRWTKSARVFFRNVDPVPFSLLAIAPSSEDPVQTPYKRGG